MAVTPRTKWYKPWNDPARGTLLFLALDCTGRSIAGISVSATTTDSEFVAAYIANGLPSTSAMTADYTGLGGVFNVPAGTITVSSQIAATSTRSGSEPAVVRAGAVKSVNVVPTP
jgi:hypothetical protein